MHFWKVRFLTPPPFWGSPGNFRVDFHFFNFFLNWLKTTSNKLSKSYFRFSVPKLVPELQALKLAHWLIFEKPRFFREAQKFFYGCRFWPQWTLFDVSHRIMGAGGTTLFERAALGGGGGGRAESAFPTFFLELMQDICHAKHAC